MPRCGCQDTCSCLITAGNGVTVEGIGTIERPYEISAETDVGQRVVFTDDGNVDFTTTGTGSTTDPLVVQASTELAMRDLTDVSDSDTPVSGDLMKWDGTQWVYEPVGPSLPNGGTAGQVLTKQSATNGDALWVDPVKELPPGGSTGQALVKTSATSYAVGWGTVSGGGGAFADPPVLAAYWRSAAQTGMSANTTILWDTAETEANGITYTPATGTFTVITTGWYLITTRVRLVAASSLATQLKIILNGTTTLDFVQGTTGTAATSMDLSKQVYLTAGTTFTIQVSSGGAGVDLSTSTAKANAVEVVRLGGTGIASERIYSSSRGHGTATSIPNAVITAVPFDNDTYEDGIAWNGTSAFIAPVTGYYQVNGILSFQASNTTGGRYALVFVNENQVASAAEAPVASGLSSAVVTVVVKANAGDLISVRAYQTSTVAVPLVASAAYNKFSIFKIPETIQATDGTIGERVYAASRASSSGQSLSHGLTVKVAFEIETRTDGIAWDATNQGFVVPVTGWYRAATALQFAAHATGFRGAHFYVNGVSVAFATDTPSGSGGAQSVTLGKDLYLTAGDQVSVYAVQNSGVSLALATTATLNFFTLTKVPAVFPQSVAIGERNYAALRKMSTTLSVPTGTATTMTWDLAEVDDGIPYAGNAFTVPVAGYYEVDAGVVWDTGTTSYRQMRIVLNGTVHSAVNLTPSAVAPSTIISKTVKCAAGDVIRIDLAQFSGSSVTIPAASSNNWVSIAKVPAPVVAGSAASGLWGSAPLDRYGSDSLVGREIYVDSRNQLRAKPIVMPGASAGLDGNSAPSAWPIGFHSLYLVASDTGAASGWPTTSAYAFVTTHRYGNEAVQMWQRLTTGVVGVAGGASEIKIRSGNVSNGWMPWISGTGPDTGWLPITWSASGWTLQNAPQARRIGRVVHLRGRVSNASFAAIASHTSLGTLPAAIPYPPVSVLLPVVSYGTTVYQRSFQITSAGDFAAQTSLANANYWDLTGSYVIDDTAT